MSETFARAASAPENRPHIRISQRHLEVLETCPRQFGQIFLERREPPPSPQQQQSMAVGSRFHLLMQQRSFGLSVDSLVGADPQICQWWDDFLAAAPEVFASDVGERSFRQAEHERTLKLLDFLLVVRYDFTIADDRAQIFDWKTYPRPPSPQKLERHWQTRLYPYILAETSDYEPDRISMTYWFVPSARDGAGPQSYQFPYSQSQHQQTHADLTRLLSQLSHWLSDYQNGQPLPTQQELSGVCSICSSRHCQFVWQSDRDFTVEETQWSNIAEIPEIPM
ncbi:MAG: PD-(D/E)XK nuclease family protein [Geitlerinemataceae cyanobacterium]